MIDLAIRILSNVPLETVIAALGSAGVLALVMQKLKGWFELQSSGVLNLINFLLSGAAIMIQGLLTATAQNPTLIPQKAAGLFALTIAVYHVPFIGIKSLSNLIAEVRDRREQKKRLSAKNQDSSLVPAAPTKVEDAAGLVPLDDIVPEIDPATAVAVTPVTPAQFATVE